MLLFAHAYRATQLKKPTGGKVIYVTPHDEGLHSMFGKKNLERLKRQIEKRNFSCVQPCYYQIGLVNYL
jgi:hypothetical protein